MKESSIQNWKNRQQNIALLFFSQLIEELLFNYTIDSFKLPAHNICTLISEARKTIEHIGNSILKEGSYDSIKCELVDIISKDKVFTSILKTNTEILFKILNKKNLQETDRLLQYIQVQLHNDYFESLAQRINEKIRNNDFDDLNRLTKYLLIEIINRGYSIEYINIINSKIFKHNRVNDASSYEEFVNSFSDEEIEYNVYFKVSNKYLQYRDFFGESFASLHETLEIRGNSEQLDQFKNLQGCILRIRTKAKDPFKAFNKAKYFVENVTSHLMSIQHQGEFTISKMGVIQNDSLTYYYNGANNPIFRRPDHLITEKAKSKLQTILRCMNSEVFELNSKQRMRLAYFRHLNSIRSVSFETQLVDMWSGVEILVPIFRNDSAGKINQIIDSIIPLITAEYFYKITYYIYRAIHSSFKKKQILRVLKQVNENLYYGLLECMMIKSYEPEYQQIYDLLNLYPLLQKRLDYYKNKLSDPKEILNLYLNHQQRVSWQIQRIYRGRNLIIHSGKTPYRLDTLIENLHYYFDSIMNKINEEASQAEKYITLEHIFLTYKFHDNNYVKYLEKSKNKSIDKVFIREIIRRKF